MFRAPRISAVPDIKKNIFIATGGTGGHIYPAIVTAEELRRRGWQVRFVGSFGLAGEKIASRGFALTEIAARGIVSKSLWQKLLAFLCQVKAFGGCLAAVRRYHPAVVLGFGGYSSFPTVLAGWVSGCKVMIHEQNAVPGLANRVLALMVPRIAVSFRESRSFFPSRKVVWTGYPLRPLLAGRPRREVLKSLGLEEGRKTILVFGGSQGSRAINQALLDCLETVARDTPWQVIHLAGKGRVEELTPRYARLTFPVFLQESVDDMADVYAAADLVIARSGAGTVTELGLLGIAAILIPYPFANSHQQANAQVLARNAAAVIIREKDLNPALLGDKIFSGLEGFGPGARQDSCGVVSRETFRLTLSGDIAADAVARLAGEVERLCYKEFADHEKK